jgi:hypothetical protein
MLRVCIPLYGQRPVSPTAATYCVSNMVLKLGSGAPVSPAAATYCVSNLVLKLGSGAHKPRLGRHLNKTCIHVFYNGICCREQHGAGLEMTL